MKKIKLKKFLAVAAGAATLLSSSSVGTIGTVTAEGGSNYYEALALSLYFFDANQCGTEVDDNCLTWRGNCHTYDAKASLDNAENLDSASKEKIRAAYGNTVDVSGGYHDAGDHVKFNTTMSFAASSLALSDYLNPGVYEKAGCKDHLKYILRKTCDYLKKTTFLDDSGNVYAICATVSNEGADHSTWTSPEDQTYDRPTYWITAANNNAEIAAIMSTAFASTAYEFKESDPAYYADCIKYAKALYSFAEKNPATNYNPNGNMYGIGDTFYDELSMTQAWLYINGEGSMPSAKPTNDGAYEFNGKKCYDGWIYCFNKLWSGYGTLMYKITGDQSYANAVQRSYNNGCPENSYNFNAGDGYWGVSRYNCALQMSALGLANGDANSSYAKGAKFQMDYILGNNSYGYSFLAGYGSKWPTHIHHRAANPGENGQTSADNPDSKYVLYGALIGGPNPSGYEDHTDRYQWTEVAVDFNGCFALACAGLANLYGGDASAINDVIKNASEINENFVFGDGHVIPPPTDPPTEPPTEEPTDEPTEPPTDEPTEPTDPPTEPPTDEPTDPTAPPTEPSAPTLLPAVKYGDVDESGSVAISDLVLLNKYLLSISGITITPQGMGNADVDGNGLIEQIDSTIILNFLSNQISESDLGKK